MKFNATRTTAPSPAVKPAKVAQEKFVCKDRRCIAAKTALDIF
jgi:hypothetical protein